MKDNIISRTVVRKMVQAVIKDPDKNIPKMLTMLETADRKHVNQVVSNIVSILGIFLSGSLITAWTILRTTVLLIILSFIAISCFN